MSWMDKLPLARFLKWLRGVLSEPDGSPSSTRVLMYVFSIFSMWLIWRCFYHIFQLHDPTMVTIWLSNMPMLVATLIGLISLPYGINKGSATFSDIANMISAAKSNNNNNNNAPMTGSLPDLKNIVMKAEGLTPQSPAASAVAPATGSPGAKG